MKSKDLTTAWHRVEVTGKTGFDTCCLIGKRQRHALGWQACGNAPTILAALLLHSRECCTHLFRLDHTNGFTINKEQIICLARYNRELAYRYTASCTQVHPFAILHLPSCHSQ